MLRNEQKMFENENCSISSLVHLSMTLFDLFWSRMNFYGYIWSFVAKYRFDWTCIIFSCGHWSKFIWSCFCCCCCCWRGIKFKTFYKWNKKCPRAKFVPQVTKNVPMGSKKILKLNFFQIGQKKVIKRNKFVPKRTKLQKELKMFSMAIILKYPSMT